MIRIASFVAVTMLAGAAYAGETPSAPGAKVFFINLKDGDVVSSPVTLKFGAAGMSIAPAGDQKPLSGHHHLNVDDEVAGPALNQPIPADERHIHFGKGQIEATVNLPKGPHTAQLLLGDWSHVPHTPPVMSERIKITVQ
jgi:hypothetical protein